MHRKEKTPLNCFDMAEKLNCKEQTHSKNNVLPTIVGLVITPETLSILYVLFRFCKVKQKRQTFLEEAEEQNKFLDKSQATKMMCD